MLDLADLVDEGKWVCGDWCTFMQGNAPIHVAKSSKKFFEERRIALLDYPACSPDLNLIENCWGCLSWKVYKGGRQYHWVNDLKEAIFVAWASFSPELLQKLVDSMPNRVFKAVHLGGATHYS